MLIRRAWIAVTTGKESGMTSAVSPSRSERPPLAALIATAERWTAEKEVDVARQHAELASLAEQVHDLEADVQQAHILLAYLRQKVEAL